MTESDKPFAQELDVTGLLCPIPVLRARRILDDMSAGQILLVKASDPAAVHDMPAFCKISGHKLHMARVEGETYLFEIEKGDARPDDQTEVDPIRTPK